MRSLKIEMPNGRELIGELDLATEQMMAMPVELIGSAQWQQTATRQQTAFKKWREYLHLMADGRVRVKTKAVA
jgi:hypothetical protein